MLLLSRRGVCTDDAGVVQGQAEASIIAAQAQARVLDQAAQASGYSLAVASLTALGARPDVHPNDDGRSHLNLGLRGVLACKACMTPPTGRPLLGHGAMLRQHNSAAARR